MSTYIPQIQDYEASHGYLEFLQPVFLKSSASSPVVLATAAVAVWLQEAWLGLFPETERAKIQLGKALKSVNEALSNPTESLQEGTLMAVLLLDLHDSLSSMVQSRVAKETHFDGMLALIKHRGQRNYETEMARRLMIAVRHQVLVYANTKGFAVDRTRQIWNEHEDHSVRLPQNKATELDFLCLKLNSLNVTMRSITQRDSLTDRAKSLGTGSLPPNLYDLLIEINALDKGFQAWYNAIPGTWRSFPVEGSTEFDMWDKSCDVYLDLNVATIINNYRVSRITLLTWAIRLTSIGGGFWLQQESRARSTLKELTDKICASVPFFLGNKFTAEEFFDPKLFYPSMSDDPDRNRSNAIQATAMGGTMLVGPIRSILELTVPNSMIDPPLLPLSQRGWLKRQLLRIAVMYNVRMDPDKFGGALPPLLAEGVTPEAEQMAEIENIGLGVSIRM